MTPKAGSGAALKGRILRVKPGEYHRDPCKVPSLSQSIAHMMLERSPRHAYTYHPRLGGTRDAPSKAMNDGTLIHRLLLGRGAELALIAANDFKKKAAQEARDAAIKAGKLPVLEYKYAEVAAIAENLRDRCKRWGFEFSGQSEVAIEFEERGEEGPVLCRAMLDHVFLEQGGIIDIKSSADARPVKCERRFVDLGYDLQYAAYTRALARLRPQFDGRVEFAFLFLELEPPFEVVPAWPSNALRTLGHSRWETAIRLWERCLLTNTWPGYCREPDPQNPPKVGPPWTVPVVLEPAPWVMSQAEAAEYL